MITHYEAGDKVVDLRTGIHYVVRNVLLHVNRDHVPITSHEIITMVGTENRVLTSLEVKPYQRVVVLMSNTGELHGVVVIPPDLVKDQFDLAEYTAIGYSQVLKGIDVEYVDSEEELENWVSEKNGDVAEDDRNDLRRHNVIDPGTGKTID